MPTFSTDDGLALWFEEAGKGRPVLCLPGLTRNARDFDPLLPHLSHYRVICLDARGRGRSEHAADFRTYNVVHEARDTLALLDHLGLDKAVVIGTSRGGLVAMAMATMAPERLAGVVLNDVGPVIEPDAIKRILDYVGRPPAAKTLDEAAQGMAMAFAADFPTLTADDWTRQAAAQFDATPTGLALRYDPRLRDALLAQAEAGPPPDLWPMFDALAPVTTGLVRGANSDLLSAETAAEMRRRHPGLHFAEVPDRGHVPLLNETESLTVIHEVLDA